MKVLKHLISAVMIFGASFVFAHGEDKPGPHGGVIRMPGAYHTEVVVLGKNRLRIYLLDINWKNPSVKNSSVGVTFGGEKAQCEKKKDSFVCEFGSGVDLTTKGKLVVESMREKQRGNVVEYGTPTTPPQISSR